MDADISRRYTIGRYQEGFTFIEMIVGLVIISFIGAAIYGILSHGLALWRISTKSLSFNEGELLAEKMTDELRNSAPIVFRPLTGDGQSVQFCLLSHGGSKNVTPETLRQPLRVRYHYDSQGRKIIRTQENYQRILFQDPANSPTSQVLASNIHIFQLQYYDFNDKAGAYEWVAEWKSACVPLALKFSVTAKTAGKVDVSSYLIPIPSGGCAS